MWPPGRHPVPLPAPIERGRWATLSDAMTNNSVSHEQEYRLTIALRPELIERLEAVRLQVGMRSRSALVEMLLEEVLLGDEPTEAVG